MRLCFSELIKKGDNSVLDESENEFKKQAGGLIVTKDELLALEPGGSETRGVVRVASLEFKFAVPGDLKSTFKNLFVCLNLEKRIEYFKLF